MKLTDFLFDVGRPVAYHPKLKKITGSTTATILLCQFIYWRGKESGGDGWLYKNSDEIEEETGLSYDEQKTARTRLINLGLMEEYYARLDHQMRFKVNLEAINEKWQMAEQDIPESGNTALGNGKSPFSLNSNSETTSETTLTPQAASEPISPPTASVPSTTKHEKKGDMVDGMLFYSAKHTGQTDLSFLNEHLRELGQAFVNAAGKDHAPKRNEQGKWIKIIKEWYEYGYTPERISKAVEKMRKDRLTIGGPESVTKTARDIRATVDQPKRQYVDVF